MDYLVDLCVGLFDFGVWWWVVVDCGDDVVLGVGVLFGLGFDDCCVCDVGLLLCGG